MKKSLLALVITALAACSKNNRACWQIYDALGNQVQIVCDKTEDEISAAYGPYYDRADAPKYCWKVHYANGSDSYPENITEKILDLFFVGAVSKEKVTCGYCQKWITREKGLKKSTGNFAYKSLLVQTFCGDTCATLFPGRAIVIRDTPDSLITVEILQKY
jgi:hypothetical protein